MRKTLVAIELWGVSQGNTGTVTGTVGGHCGDSEQETEKEKEKSSKREKVKEKEINKKERMEEVCVYKEDTHEKTLLYLLPPTPYILIKKQLQAKACSC